MALIAEAEYDPYIYYPNGFLVFGLKLNTQGRTDCASYSSDELAGYHFQAFNLLISSALNEHMESYELKSRFGKIEFKHVECCFHLHMIKVACSFKFNVHADHFRHGTEAFLNRFMRQMCNRVNAALEHYEINFPKSLIYFGSYNSELLADRFWIPIEKNQAYRCINWYSIRATEPCYLKETLSELTRKKRSFSGRKRSVWDDDIKELAVKKSIILPDNGDDL